MLKARSVRALVFPGMDGTGRLLTEFRDALRPWFEPEIATWPATAAGYADLLPLARAHLPAAGDFILVAESFSGPLAIQLAAERPRGLAGLVLCASFAEAPHRWARRLRSLLGLPLPRPPVALLMPLAMGRWSTRAWTQRVRAAMAEVAPSTARNRLAAILAADAMDDLSRLGCPLLYLQASDDRLVPPRCWEAIRSARPDARMARLQGPHFILQCKPEVAAREISRCFGNP